MFWVGFTVGVVLGAHLGAFALALCVASKRKPKCICPTECDCQAPPTHISNHCPVHNTHPLPYPDCLACRGKIDDQPLR